MKQFLYLAANLLGGVVIVLLLLDPTRPLLPIVGLLVMAVWLLIGAALMQPRQL